MKINLSNQVNQRNINPSSEHRNLLYQSSYLLSSEDLGLYLNSVFKKHCLTTRSTDRSNTEFQLKRHDVESYKFQGWNLIMFKVKSINQKKKKRTEWSQRIKTLIAISILGKILLHTPEEDIFKVHHTSSLSINLQKWLSPQTCATKD